MYSSLQIRGYRGLNAFGLNRLGRVNLLVGTNNSGKTSILECIELLRAAGSPSVFTSILGRRGEWSYDSDDNRPPLVDISHLFSNRDLDGTISIEAERAANALSHGWNDKVAMSVQHPRIGELELENPEFLEEEDEFFLSVKWSAIDEEFRTGITSEGFMTSSRRFFRPRNDPDQPVQFIRTNGMMALDIMRLFDDIVLTDSEEYVTQALRIIEPGIERIASVNLERRPFPREGPSGIYLKLSNVAQRVPIGSAGDGMWRMLGLALALANAKNGVILVDEIDTGLHYSVMMDMWRMVVERSAAQNTQVFATTHSRDCYESLAGVLKAGSFPSGVTIQRVDPAKEHATIFDNDGIIAAAERGIEVR